jgi:hypothetical protein
MYCVLGADGNDREPDESMKMDPFAITWIGEIEVLRLSDDKMPDDRLSMSLTLYSRTRSRRRGSKSIHDYDRHCEK